MAPGCAEGARKPPITSELEWTLTLWSRAVSAGTFRTTIHWDLRWHLDTAEPLDGPSEGGEGLPISGVRAIALTPVSALERPGSELRPSDLILDVVAYHAG